MRGSAKTTAAGLDGGNRRLTQPASAIPPSKASCAHSNAWTPMRHGRFSPITGSAQAEPSQRDVASALRIAAGRARQGTLSLPEWNE